MPFKPIQTGVEGLLDGDIGFTLNLLGQKLDQETLELLQPFRYKMPASPHLAAMQESRQSPSFGVIKKNLTILQNCYDFIVAEGAGGILVPIDLEAKTSMADLASSIGFPVILVSQSGLGAINDTLLSIEAMQKRALKIAGFLLNDTEPNTDTVLAEDNAKTIQTLSRVNYLGRIPYIKTLNKDNLLKTLSPMDALKNTLKDLYEQR